MILGFISVHMITEAYISTEGRLGSLMEMVYYYTSDRSAMLFVGV